MTTRHWRSPLPVETTESSPGSWGSHPCHCEHSRCRSSRPQTTSPPVLYFEGKHSPDLLHKLRSFLLKVHKGLTYIRLKHHRIVKDQRQTIFLTKSGPDHGTIMTIGSMSEGEPHSFLWKLLSGAWSQKKFNFQSTELPRSSVLCGPVIAWTWERDVQAG